MSEAAWASGCRPKDTLTRRQHRASHTNPIANGATRRSTPRARWHALTLSPWNPLSPGSPAMPSSPWENTKERHKEASRCLRRAHSGHRSLEPCAGLNDLFPVLWFSPSSVIVHCRWVMMEYTYADHLITFQSWFSWISGHTLQQAPVDELERDPLTHHHRVMGIKKLFAANCILLC